jgi:hypothetical protein
MTGILDLLNPDHAYLFGFLQCDGTLSRGPGEKGRLSVELAAADAAHLRTLAEIIPARTSLRVRTRDTNFKLGHTSCTLSVGDRRFRAALRHLGLPEGRKSASIAPPRCEFSALDYYRGVVDADGSLGLAGDGRPFVSLCTTSAPLALAFGAFIEEVSGQPKRVRPNARDAAFNVMCWNERAQDVVAALYLPNRLALPRKAARARDVLAWRRPPHLRRHSRRAWSVEEDRIVLESPPVEAMELLQRSRASVTMRARRLRAGKEATDAP